MQQKLKDWGLLLKNDRRYQVGAGVGVIALLFTFFHDASRGGRPKKSAPQAQSGTISPGAGEAGDDIVRAFKADLEALRSESSESRRLLDDTRKQREQDVQRTSEILKAMLTRLSDQEGSGAGSVQNTSVRPGQVTESGGAVDTLTGLDGTDSQGLESFGGEQPQIAPPPPAPQAKKVAVVGAGDSVRIKLLAGVNAPTDGTPYPVVFKLIGDVAGPDGSTLPLGEARLIAAAQGSLTDSRALFRLTSLNMRYPDGRRNVLEVDGWVVGEDGLRGMEGILIDPIGKAIGASVMGGALEGLSEAFASKNVTTSNNIYGGQTVAVTGSETEYAAGKGLAGGAKTYSKLIESRVNRLIPQVQVLSGREATAVFARSFKVPGLIEQLEQEEDIYSTLD